MRNPEISIVIPAQDEEESIPELCQWIDRVMQSHGLSYEVIIVDDGSTDSTWQKILQVSEGDSRFKGIRLNRNFGKSAALQTGFRAVSGRVVITMDADLQDSPEEIPEMYAMVKEKGYHLVSGWKKRRYDPVSKTIPSKFFNYVTRKLSGIELHDFNCGLKAYQLSVVRNITVYGEMHRYIPLIAKWAGFTRITEKVVQHQERKYGRTKFGIERVITGFLDLASITFVTRFRQKPMHFFGVFGSLSFVIGFMFTAKIFWHKMDSLYFSKVPLARDITEQPLFYLALVALIIGVQLFVTGFLAEMFAMQSLTKRDYLVIDKVGFEEDTASRKLPSLAS
ncbi:MAG: glycosyltransferase family 2 protein [Cyclobacteriaceae bacterium]